MNGSCGRLVSRDDRSFCEALREPTLRAAARAFALGLNGELVRGEGDDGEGSADPILEVLRSEDADRDLGPRGTVKLLMFGVEELGESGDCARGMRSGGGVVSAGGMGSPRPAARS
jgi:hypothetical protein